MEDDCAKAEEKDYAKIAEKIARNIELYSSAYRIAWKQISPFRKQQQPNIALQLHAFIRRLLKKGATDPLFIATEAFKALGESEPGTQ